MVFGDRVFRGLRALGKDQKVVGGSPRNLLQANCLERLSLVLAGSRQVLVNDKVQLSDSFGPEGSIVVVTFLLNDPIEVVPWARDVPLLALEPLDIGGEGAVDFAEIPMLQVLMGLVRVVFARARHFYSALLTDDAPPVRPHEAR